MKKFSPLLESSKKRQTKFVGHLGRENDIQHKKLQ